ncbi:hypothetical protein Plhal304r1_c039g0116821 [Plasmopara halstedii]
MRIHSMGRVLSISLSLVDDGCASTTTELMRVVGLITCSKVGNIRRSDSVKCISTLMPGHYSTAFYLVKDGENLYSQRLSRITILRYFDNCNDFRSV